MRLPRQRVLCWRLATQLGGMALSLLAPRGSPCAAEAASGFECSAGSGDVSMLQLQRIPEPDGEFGPKQSPIKDVLGLWGVGQKARKPPGWQPTAVVRLPSGAKVLGNKWKGGRVFYDIQYATAGRFERPQVRATSNGQVINAREPQDITCFQHGDEGFVGTEACLFLDVYLPPARRTWWKRRAVMVWFHGGGFAFGSKWADWASFFAFDNDVVLVSVNYRLNVFGFWTDLEPSTSKNFGLRDQIAALRWVQENAAFFGGNPSSVTIFGESAGGLSVTALLHSPMARGLFHKAIAQSPWQSPGQFAVPSKLAAATMGTYCLRAMNCTNVECLRKAPTEAFSVCAAYFDLPKFAITHGMYFSGYDGEVLIGSVDKSWCGPSPVVNADIPVLTGSMSHEWRMSAVIGLDPYAALHDFLMHRLQGYDQARPEVRQCARERLLELYADATEGDCGLCPLVEVEPNLVQALGDITFTRGAQMTASAPGVQHYRYVLDVEDAGGMLGATHAVDLCYFFPQPSEGTPMIPGICQWAQRKQQMATGKVLREYWASFAKTGRPRSLAGPEWLHVDSSRLGVPFLRLKLGGKGMMSDSAYFNDAAAKLLGGMVCQEVLLNETSAGGCDLIDASTGAPWLSQQGATRHHHG